MQKLVIKRLYLSISLGYKKSDFKMDIINW